MKNRGMNRTFRFIVLFSFVIILNGCEKSSEPSIASDGNFLITLKSPVMAPKFNIDGLQILETKILVRDLKLISTFDDDSMNVEIGPFVLNINPSGTPNTYTFDSNFNGSFESIKWKIHKPEDNEVPPDPDFQTGESGNDRFSVIVSGVYNGVPFVYKSSKSTQQVIDFDQPIVIVPTTKINVTLTVDPYSWFISNGVILDPFDSQNENEIDNLISNSFKEAFRDDNLDGNPDN